MVVVFHALSSCLIDQLTVVPSLSWGISCSFRRLRLERNSLEVMCG